MTDEPVALMEAVVIESTKGLFSSCGIELHEVPAPASQPQKAAIAGLVGFTGESIRGTLMIASSFDIFARSRPSEVKTHELSEFVARDWLYLRDWAAEVANQLLGRIKNRLFSYGVVLRVSTPTALSGAALAVATPSSKRTHPKVLAVGDDEVWVWWDVVVEPDFVLEPQEEKAATEGDVILF